MLTVIVLLLYDSFYTMSLHLEDDGRSTVSYKFLYTYQPQGMSRPVFLNLQNTRHSLRNGAKELDKRLNTIKSAIETRNAQLAEDQRLEYLLEVKYQHRGLREDRSMKASQNAADIGNVETYAENNYKNVAGNVIFVTYASKNKAMNRWVKTTVQIGPNMAVIAHASDHEDYLIIMDHHNVKTWFDTSRIDNENNRYKRAYGNTEAYREVAGYNVDVDSSGINDRDDKWKDHVDTISTYIKTNDMRLGLQIIQATVNYVFGVPSTNESLPLTAKKPQPITFWPVIHRLREQMQVYKGLKRTEKEVNLFTLKELFKQTNDVEKMKTLHRLHFRRDHDEKFLHINRMHRQGKIANDAAHKKIWTNIHIELSNVNQAELVNEINMNDNRGSVRRPKHLQNKRRTVILRLKRNVMAFGRKIGSISATIFSNGFVIFLLQTTKEIHKQMSSLPTEINLYSLHYYREVCEASVRSVFAELFSNQYGIVHESQISTDLLRELGGGDDQGGSAVFSLSDFPGNQSAASLSDVIRSAGQNLSNLQQLRPAERGRNDDDVINYFVSAINQNQNQN